MCGLILLLDEAERPRVFEQTPGQSRQDDDPRGSVAVSDGDPVY